MKKIISKTISVALVALTIWIAGSFIEVTSKNLDSNPTYSKTNFFVILTKGE